MSSTTTTPYQKERRLFFMAFSLVLTLFAAYVYFVSASVVHVIVRKEINRDIAEVSSRISELEADFITAKDGITEETVVAHGFFITEPEKIYITKTPSSLVLLSNQDESRSEN